MPRALVIVEDPDRDRSLLERARSFAVGEGTDIVVLALTTPDEYEDMAETLDTIGRAENTTYSETDILEGITGDIDDVASDVFGESVEYELHTQVAESDDQTAVILDTAEQTDCDHVFTSGRQRSPTGKAVFGDRTQQIILNFDGFVTVDMD